jgi:hypothetical protein
LDAESTGCREQRFADDFATSKVYVSDATNYEIVEDLKNPGSSA